MTRTAKVINPGKCPKDGFTSLRNAPCVIEIEYDDGMLKPGREALEHAVLDCAYEYCRLGNRGFSKYMDIGKKGYFEWEDLADIPPIILNIYGILSVKKKEPGDTYAFSQGEALLTTDGCMDERKWARVF